MRSLGRSADTVRTDRRLTPIPNIPLKSLAGPLRPGSSAFFAVIRKAKPEPFIERLKFFAGSRRVLLSTMISENEADLRKPLEYEIVRRGSCKTYTVTDARRHRSEE